MRDDSTVRILSNYMRAMQDYYLRTLNYIASKGYYEFLTTFLHPEYANYNVSFKGLNPNTLTFKSIVRQYQPTNGTRSLAARSVRIAFEELREYCAKTTSMRKSLILGKIDGYLSYDRKKIDNMFSEFQFSAFDISVQSILRTYQSIDEKDKAIQREIEKPEFSRRIEKYSSIRSSAPLV